MSLTLSILSQMVDGFIHCYETEMKQWSGREKPHLSGEKYNLALYKFWKRTIICILQGWSSVSSKFFLVSRKTTM